MLRAAFPAQLYRRRALVASVFSAVKGKLSARAPGRETSKCSGYRHCSVGAGLQPHSAQTLPSLKHRIGLIEGCQQSQATAIHYPAVGIGPWKMIHVPPASDRLLQPV